MASCRLPSFQETVVFIATATLIVGNDANTWCPKTVQIEKGQDSTIFCYSYGKNVSDVYWYRGSRLSSGPILKLEDGIPGGLEYGVGHYDISQSGAMIIRNASVDHEAVYTFVTYFKDRSHESNDVIVNITITPYPACPLVDYCSSCGTCEFNITDRPSGKLTCSITNVRPQMEINWLIKTRNNITFVIHRPTWLKNMKMDSWSAETEISYTSEECGGEAVLHCNGSDDYRLLNYSFTQVKLFTAKCKEVPFAVTDTVWLVPIILALVGIITIVTVSFLIYCSKKGAVPKDVQKALRLKSLLKEEYGAACTLPSFLSGETISIEFLYTGCQCEISYNDGDKTNTPSDKLLAQEPHTTGKRVLILGNAGYGKTVFCKSLIQQWISDKEENFILIFIPLKGVTKEMKLSTIVKNNFPRMKDDITVENIQKIVAKNSCVVLLDGLNEMVLESIDDTIIDEDSQLLGIKTHEVKRSEEQFTIADCLNGKINSYCSDVCVWVTSRKDNENMFLNYNTIIRLQSFTKNQLMEYIKKCCSLCNSTNETSICGSPDEENIETDNDQNDDDTLVKISLNTVNTTTPKSKHDGEENTEHEFQNDPAKEISFYIFEYLDKRDIIDDFIEMPHLLLPLIQILTSQFTSKTNQEGQVSNVSDINIAALTDCLVTYMGNMYSDESGKGLSSSESTTLKAKLQELAIETAFKDSFSIDSLPTDVNEYVNIAFAIGYLQTQEPLSPANMSLTNQIGFCHPYIHDYFTIYNIIQNPVNLERVIEAFKRNKTHRRITFCKFCSFLKNPLLEELCDLLINSKMINHVIHCLFETYKNEDTKRIVTKVSNHQINLPHQEGYFHQEAVKAFCNVCVEMKKTVECIVFAGQWSLPFFETIRLPQLKRLEFYNMDFTENNFISCLLLVKEKNMTNTLRFIECVLPDELSEQFKLEVKQFKSSKLKVYRIANLATDIKPSSFDYNTGTWTAPWTR